MATGYRCDVCGEWVSHERHGHPDEEHDHAQRVGEGAPGAPGHPDLGDRKEAAETEKELAKKYNRVEA